MHFSTLFFPQFCWIFQMTQQLSIVIHRDCSISRLSPVTTARTHTAAHIFIAMPRSKKVLRNTH